MEFFKQWWFWVIVGVFVCGFIGIIITPQDDQTSSKQDTDTNDTEVDTEIWGALQKCAINEQHDLLTTGWVETQPEGIDTLKKAEETCMLFLTATYNGDRELFIKDLNIDWENNKNEKFPDGMTLEEKLVETYNGNDKLKNYTTLE